MAYHPVTEKISNLLRERGVWFETFEHEPVRTSEEAAAVRPEYTISQGSKALIVRVKKGGIKSFAMVVVPGDKKFDAKKLRSTFGLQDLRFATEAEVAEITGGVKPGGVPPFGNIFALTVYADDGIFVNEKIIFNAGDRAFSIGMYASDYDAIVQPLRGDIASN
jgi:prolyl-tRNA editing enzyme YbaK/EbsC (Cys-tRNA(Pro) deacylase)